MAATMSAKREALTEFARSRRGGAGRMVVRLALAFLVLSLIILIGAWLAGFFSTPREVLVVRAAVDGQVAELERMSRGEVSFGAGAESFGPVMQAMRDVPEQYRDQARREMGRLFEAREAAEVDSYFAVPPERRAAELDRRIKQEETRRARWEAERERRSAERGGSGGGPGNPPEVRGGPGGPQAAGGPPPAAADQSAAAPPPMRRRGDGTEESRNRRSKQRLDQTSAVSRARSTEYRRAKDQRRIQLGLEPRR